MYNKRQKLGARINTALWAAIRKASHGKSVTSLPERVKNFLKEKESEEFGGCRETKVPSPRGKKIVIAAGLHFPYLEK